MILQGILNQRNGRVSRDLGTLGGLIDPGCYVVDITNNLSCDDHLMLEIMEIMNNLI
jgi:hypothetical protein